MSKLTPRQERIATVFGAHIALIMINATLCLAALCYIAFNPDKPLSDMIPFVIGLCTARCVLQMTEECLKEE